MADGRRSLGDVPRVWERKKVPRYGLSKKLQANCWLQYSMLQCESMTAFEAALYNCRVNSRLLEKWKKGLHHPTRASALRIEEVAPGGLELYDLPLWRLLENEPIGLKEIDRLMAPFRTPARYWWSHYSFPNDEELQRTHRYGGVTVADDIDGLFQRGDIYGFTAIVAAVRRSEVRGDPTHGEACAFMYRALPSLYKLPWFSSQRVLLEACVNALRARVWMSLMKFDVDWDVINRQATDSGFEPKRELRRRDPFMGRFIPLEDPIMYAEWIPGAEVKRQRLLEAAAIERSRQPQLSSPVS